LTAKDNAPNNSGDAVVKMSISNRGRSSIASDTTPLGRYKKGVADAIGSRWYYVDEKLGSMSVGSVEVNFKINSSGKVTNLHIVKITTANESFAEGCIRSINDAKLPPIPPALLESKGKDGIEISYSFTVY
jgi:outer membrane biosynthesis protein TonB